MTCGLTKLLPEAVDRPPFFYHACNALAFAERYEEVALKGFAAAEAATLKAALRRLYANMDDLA